ncbi:DUF998 domain-containing protein [Aequorivita capsosiphonis]|uniref:DUF998 domain-containing protein n=1 Tax=Aequorivita capsosiphonis TaxID=487317 RepID=UPI0004005343|nr:DUF998 domain-containing protein [Aequorivita capsosiphonis]
MTNRNYAILGLISPILFGATYFIMANQRPEYSFLYKLVSELGSLDAPNKWTWNILGYIIPGILISMYSIGLYKSMAEKKSSKLPLIGIFLTGFFLMFSGVFPADLDNRSSITTIFHMIGSYGSYLSFLIGTFTYSKLMKDNNYWKSSNVTLLIFVWLTIASGTWSWFFPNIPSVGQRVNFFFVFAWIAYTAVKLYRLPKENPIPNKLN